MLKKMNAFLYQSLLLLVGSILCAVAVKSLMVPHGFLSRGLTGLVLLIYYKWPALSLGILYFLVNIPVFVLGWWVVGKRFIAYSLWGMTIYSIALSTIHTEIHLPDPMLSAVIAGALSGIGTALILRSWGSSGGSEILYVVINKWFSMTLGTGAILINSVVLILSALIFPMEKVLYTLVFLFVSAIFTDKVFHGMAKRRAAIIISDRWENISQALVSRRIGITLLKGKGGFRGTERTLLYSVVPARSVPTLKRVVADIDTSAFIAIMEADDVTGMEVGNQPHW